MVALPDEAELRKVFSLRTIAWLRQISEITGLTAGNADLEAMVSANSPMRARSLAADVAALRVEVATLRAANASLRAKIDNLEKVVA